MVQQPETPLKDGWTYQESITRPTFGSGTKAAFETRTFASALFGDFDSFTLRCKHQKSLIAMDLELNKENPSYQHIISSLQN
jgi:hypothetical protein